MFCGLARTFAGQTGAIKRTKGEHWAGDHKPMLGVRHGVEYHHRTGGYSWNAGTSMAAPHVSGVAALIVGKHGGDLAPAQVERILRASADDLGKAGKDAVHGFGRVNAARAVSN